MKSSIKVVKEQIENFYLVRRLSLYELKSKNKSNYLGMAWEIINPVIQILIYWFVFGSIREKSEIELSNGEDVSFIAWLLGGFILWIFFYKSTIEGSKSIYSRLRMLSKMNFPMSVIPNVVIFSQFYVHLFMLLITIIILHFMGFFINIYYLQFFYFIFATFCLLFSLSLIMSTLSTIIRDVHMFLNATLRMLLYLSPILWPISEALSDNQLLIMILKLNPLYYLIEGYRSALFGTDWYFVTNWEYTIYFWGLIIVLFLFGSMLHVKFRRHFIDYL
ncbi:teichoic acid transport system permease protein [Oceanobacillus limi]|uniref:Transport permease protein n=1 Tax=Oceanobacillus limi TaxID=930131 RepID=A0A1I0A2U7_9BACI|nr:ABC transporter permease [Oceanobacillus limi]SES88012.1 teichoic acid transport system permease protein [Oceanobacillus limi]